MSQEQSAFAMHLVTAITDGVHLQGAKKLFAAGGISEFSSFQVHLEWEMRNDEPVILVGKLL